MMQSGLDDLTKQRMLQSRALSQEARGESASSKDVVMLSFLDPDFCVFSVFILPDSE